MMEAMKGERGREQTEDVDLGGDDQGTMDGKVAAEVNAPPHKDRLGGDETPLTERATGEA